MMCLLSLEIVATAVFLCHYFIEGREIHSVNPDFTIENNNINTDTLTLVHILFRHGDRTPSSIINFPKGKYKNENYLPYGRGQLTGIGRRRMYNVGRTFRKRYIKFLGERFTPGVVDARSTDTIRTKVSLELVLAGLFPPIGEQVIAPGLNWQPIPYTYHHILKDKILFSKLGHLYRECLKDYLQTEKMQLELKKYKELFDYLSEHTGWNVTDFDGPFNAYFQLTSEKEWGFELPEWAASVYPEALENIILEEYKIVQATNCLRTEGTGHFLEKIVHDTVKKIEWSQAPQDVKLYLYAAHEFNIANVLNALEVFDKKIPTYGSYILFEIHHIQGVYGVKIFYENFSGSAPRLLKIPSCEEFCPFTQFTAIIKDYIS